jgi:hypothetical protein
MADKLPEPRTVTDAYLAAILRQLLAITRRLDKLVKEG